MEENNTTNGDTMTTATTILSQLGGLGRLTAMTGAHNVLDHGDGVSFKFRGSRKAGYCHITLEPSDTYTVVLGKIRKYELKKTADASGIYAGQLVELFERETGLYLSI